LRKNLNGKYIQTKISNFSATGISWREQVTFQCDGNGVHIVLDQHH